MSLPPSEWPSWIATSRSWIPRSHIHPVAGALAEFVEVDQVEPTALELALALVARRSSGAHRRDREHRLRECLRPSAIRDRLKRARSFLGVEAESRDHDADPPRKELEFGPASTAIGGNVADRAPCPSGVVRSGIILARVGDHVQRELPAASTLTVDGGPVRNDVAGGVIAEASDRSNGQTAVALTEPVDAEPRKMPEPSQVGCRRS